MIIGAALFLAGALSFMAVLFASGGWQRSRQFAVIGKLWKGRLGDFRRRLTQLSLALIALGAVLCFTAVAMMDAERADRCQDHCQALGHEEGMIGPSQDRSPTGRFVACICRDAGQADREMRADSLR